MLLHLLDCDQQSASTGTENHPYIDNIEENEKVCAAQYYNHYIKKIIFVLV